MEDFIAGLVTKVGIPKDAAEKVFHFLHGNIDKLPQWFGAEKMKGMLDKLPGGIGHKIEGALGIDTPSENPLDMMLKGMTPGPK